MLDCIFEAVPLNECPCNSDLPECTAKMDTNSLCEADQPLPDGNSNYKIDNCNEYDVFRCTRGYTSFKLYLYVILKHYL